MKKNPTKQQVEATKVVDRLKIKYSYPHTVTCKTLSKAMGICVKTFYKRIKTNGWTEGDVIVINYLDSKSDEEIIEIIKGQLE